MPRIIGSELPGVPGYRDLYVEYLALDYVIGNLERNGWTWRFCKRLQVGYDLEARKDHSSILIEVKGRSIGEYSGTRNESRVQKETPRRRFRFSKPQLEQGDYFIAVFVGPLVRKAIVMSHKDLIKLKDGGDDFFVSFRLDSNLEFMKTKKWRVGRTADITPNLEGWNLLEE